MRTPWGFECRFFYGDYFRGRKTEECRLIGIQPPPNQWQPKLCKTCPVPGILRANACPNLILNARVDALFWGLIRNVKVTATCSLSNEKIAEPYIGCGKCHNLDFKIGGEKNEPDRPA
jgi:hypothetical protein